MCCFGIIYKCRLCDKVIRDGDPYYVNLTLGRVCVECYTSLKLVTSHLIKIGPRVQALMTCKLCGTVLDLNQSPLPIYMKELGAYICADHELVPLRWVMMMDKCRCGQPIAIEWEGEELCEDCYRKRRVMTNE